MTAAMDSTIRIILCVVVLAAAALAQPGAATGDAAFQRVRLWRAQPKRVLSQFTAPDWCGNGIRAGEGPCTTSYFDYARVQGLECLLMGNDGQVRRERGVRDRFRSEIKVYKGRLSRREVAELGQACGLARAAGWDARRGASHGFPESQDAVCRDRLDAATSSAGMDARQLHPEALRGPNQAGGALVGEGGEGPVAADRTSAERVHRVLTSNACYRGKIFL